MRYYSIQHLTSFDYAHSVSESAMEMRMQPRSDSNQRCLTFSLSVSPRCRVFSYRDHLGNHIHHFDIPGEHRQLVIVAESLVEQQPLGPIPKRLYAGGVGRAGCAAGAGRFLGDAAAQRLRRADARRCARWRRSGGLCGATIRFRCCTRSAATSTTTSNICREARRWIRRSMWRCSRGEACARTSRTS